MKNKELPSAKNKSIYPIFQPNIQKDNQITHKIMVAMINIFDSLSRIPFIQIEHMDETKKIR